MGDRPTCQWNSCSSRRSVIPMPAASSRMRRLPGRATDPPQRLGHRGRASRCGTRRARRPARPGRRRSGRRRRWRRAGDPAPRAARAPHRSSSATRAPPAPGGHAEQGGHRARPQLDAHLLDVARQPDDRRLAAGADHEGAHAGAAAGRQIEQQVERAIGDQALLHRRLDRNRFVAPADLRHLIAEPRRRVGLSERAVATGVHRPGELVRLRAQVKALVAGHAEILRLSPDGHTRAPAFFFRPTLEGQPKGADTATPRGAGENADNSGDTAGALGQLPA